MEIASPLMFAFPEVLTERKFNWAKCTPYSWRSVIKERKEKGFGFHLYLFLEFVRCSDSMVLRRHKRLVEHFITHITVKAKNPKGKKKKQPQNMRSMTALKILIKINLTRPLKPF